MKHVLVVQTSDKHLQSKVLAVTEPNTHMVGKHFLFMISQPIHSVVLLTNILMAMGRAGILGLIFEKL